MFVGWHSCFGRQKTTQAEPCPPRAIFNNEAHGVILGVWMPQGLVRGVRKDPWD